MRSVDYYEYALPLNTVGRGYADLEAEQLVDDADDFGRDQRPGHIVVVVQAFPWS